MKGMKRVGWISIGALTKRMNFFWFSKKPHDGYAIPIYVDEEMYKKAKKTIKKQRQ